MEKDFLDAFVEYQFRKINLEETAKEQQSDLNCPYCKTNLPCNPMTVGKQIDGFDANYRSMYKTSYFCTLCQKYFKIMPESVQLEFKF